MRHALILSALLALAGCSSLFPGKEAPSCRGEVRDLNPELWDTGQNDLAPASPAAVRSRRLRS